MTSFRTAIAIAVGTLFAGTALAQSSYEIEQRDRQQQAHIYQGIQSGELTRPETRELMEDRARIERMERRARADGMLSQNERNRIDNAQDRLGRNIYQEKHDRQDRNDGWRGRDNRHAGWDRNRGWDNRHSGWDNRHSGWDRRDQNNVHSDRQHGRDGRDHNNGNSDNGRDHAWNRGDQNNGSHGNRTGNSTGATTSTSGHVRGSGGWSGRQASMPQAQARSTPSQGTRTFAASRQGGNSGRRSR